jgi:hypothetical protein
VYFIFKLVKLDFCLSCDIFLVSILNSNNCVTSIIIIIIIIIIHFLVIKPVRVIDKVMHSSRITFAVCMHY